MKKEKTVPKGDVEMGKRIRKLRIQRDMTQKQLAEQVMVSPSSITRLETGDTMVSVFTLKRIAQVLDVSADFILGTEACEEEARRSLSGLAGKLDACTPKQRDTFINAIEQILDSFLT